MAKKLDDMGYVSDSPIVVVEKKTVKHDNTIDISGLGPRELLQVAAALLDEQTGPRAPKYYRNLAAQVRELAARV